MLIQEGEARNRAANLRLACGLALIAGGLNSAGFYTAGVFSANMTGNVSILAVRLALGDLAAGLFYLTLLVLFVAGAALSALLIRVGRRRGVTRIYVFSILAEAALLMLLGGADLWLSEARRGLALTVGLSFLMGLQNATVTRISNARVRTTHISGMATDAGIELGTLADLALCRLSWAHPRKSASLCSGHRDEEAGALAWERLGLHGATIGAFCLGGVIGVLLYQAVGAWMLFGAAAALFGLALPGFFRAA